MTMRQARHAVCPAETRHLEVTRYRPIYCSAVDYGSGPVSMGSNSNSFFNDSHFSTNYSADSADRIFGVPARTIDDDFEVDSRLSLGAFDVSGGSMNPYGKVSDFSFSRNLSKRIMQN